MSGEVITRILTVDTIRDEMIKDFFSKLKKKNTHCFSTEKIKRERAREEMMFCGFQSRGKFSYATI